MKLAVNIATDNDWSAYWYNIGFFGENFPGLFQSGVTFSQSALTSASGKGLQLSISAICRSILV